MSQYHQHLIPGDDTTELKQFVLDPNFYNQSITGFYRGIVIQNNDPERRGRVKLFIPAFSPHIYNKWLDDRDDQKTDTSIKDKKFRFPQGSNINNYGCTDEARPALNQIFEEAKKIVDWAEQASSLIGAGTSGLYGFEKNKSTISDASTEERFSADKNAQCANNIDAVNIDNIAEKGGFKYEIDDDNFDLQDGFVSLNNDKMPEVNAFAKVYKPSTYSNKTKGMFTVPNVGALCWVFFEGGDITKPVYFAYSYDRQDWQGIYDIINAEDKNNGPDYPGAFENTAAKDGEVVYKKGKTVFNSKAGSLEFIDTDDYEQVKLTHAGGSFFQFSNKATVRYCDKNDQSLIGGDQFETVNLTKNLHVRKNFNVGIDETKWTRVGSWNEYAYSRWKELNRIVADTRARFAIKRANAMPSDGITMPAGSTQQERRGRYASNPVLQESKSVITSPAIQQVYKTTPIASAATGNQSTTLETATTPVQSNQSQLTNSVLTPDAFNAAAGATGSANFEGDPTRSASTEGGEWEVDTEYQNINELETKQAESMLEYETQFGNGGDEINEITRHRVDIIGVVFNDSPAVRVDPIGRSNFNEVLVDSKGTFASRRPSPLVERVANDGKFPCGNYSLIIGNNFSINAGSGGMHLMTTGCFDIAGSQIVIAGSEEVILSSTGDININSGSKFSVTADIITFRQSQGKQVAIDGSLGVKNNIVIGGGAYVEGELFVNHITAPVEIQETESTVLYGKTVPGKVIGWAPHDNGYITVYGGTPTGTYADDDSILNVEHSHNFKNLPLSLKANNEGVRAAATEINKGSNLVTALPIRNGMKSIT